MVRGISLINTADRRRLRRMVHQMSNVLHPHSGSLDLRWYEVNVGVSWSQVKMISKMVRDWRSSLLRLIIITVGVR